MPRDRRKKRKRARTQGKHSHRIIDLTQAHTTIYHNVGHSPCNPIILGEAIVPIKLDFGSDEDDEMDVIAAGPSGSHRQSSPNINSEENRPYTPCNYSRESSSDMIDDMLATEQYSLSPLEIGRSANTLTNLESQIIPQTQSLLDTTRDLSFDMPYRGGTGTTRKSPVSGKKRLGNIYQPMSPVPPIQDAGQLNLPPHSPLNTAVAKKASGAMHPRHLEALNHCIDHQTDSTMLEVNGGPSEGRGGLELECLITVPRWSLKSVHADSTPYDQLFQSMTYSCQTHHMVTD